jgi:holo-[acyl-carrier protein] synthase
VLSAPSGRIGFGIDLMTVCELERLLDRGSWFKDYFFCPKELYLCSPWAEERRLEFLAGRFCAKESLQKALFSLLRRRVQVRPSDITILQAEDRRPVIQWNNNGVDIERYSMALSISHKAGVCVSAAIIYKSKDLLTEGGLSQ